MKPYHCDYCDEKLEFKLDSGTKYKSNFFSNGVSITDLASPNYDERIKLLEINEYQLYIEALSWLDLDIDEICGLVFKEQMSVQ